MGEPQLKIYRIEGLSCANCAAKFEKNVKELQGVEDAKLNFGASKISVQGAATIADLEKAGAFENLKIRDEDARVSKPEPFWKQKANIKVLISAILLVFSWFLSKGEADGWLSAAGYAAAILAGGYSLFITGIQNLVRFRFDMHTLMTVAIIGAAFLGEWAEGAAVVILFAISEALEKYSMDKARRSIGSLMDIAPKEALIRRDGVESVMAVADIRTEDIMIVKPGKKLAMDGVVVRGTSTVNQAAITGESMPVPKTEADEVFAGTLNGEGLLEVLVTKLVKDTTLSKIIHLVEEAQAERAPSQAFVDKFAKYYTPAIILIALGIGLIPPVFLNGDWSEWIYRGLAVLVVGCPCALVISTPVAIVTAIGNAAKNGVLIKGGVYLEELGSISAIAFDKTGTLTKGVPQVTDFLMIAEQENQEKWLAAAAALEKNSDHPLASAILREADRRGTDYRSIKADYFQSLTGKGIRGEIDGMVYFVGSPKLFHVTDEADEHISRLQKEGKTVIAIGTEESLKAVIAVADEIRESSKEAIRKLHDLGIQKTIMLTGDNEGTAQTIGRKAGVHAIESELLPEDKLTFIKQEKISHQKVAMVGDGVNDAPALAASTVGIAMGGAGTDTALETADIALMADDLQKLPFTVKLSRKTIRIIKQNISFSLAIKLLALIMIAPGWLTLWLAIFADMGATLIVTLNSLRLLKAEEQRDLSK
ncbi:heavy metal translocating P-type ATPase [Bacillus massiliglaciei]|uniref:heavy metal translocating P-type ATPase n=1 Tax=Bacillus massiliglaciei TaxID=1816693 RepID=UPI000A4AC93D|nr:heavy metal translocating P-type ATPase [Bacillus massiliglaciei]